MDINNGKFYLNGKEVFIFSGEVHYFRIYKNQWQDRIKKAKRAGLNTLSSYIPWSWHNIKESKFDFTGKTFPERDIVAFLELLKKERMYFIARIGPVSNGEIIYDGLPAWLLEKYPQIKLKDYAGRTNPYSTLINYHHPKFLEKVKKWYDRLLIILKKYVIQNNGPIILFQLDNEISMLNWLTKTPNYTSANTKLFRKFLKNKFNNIKNLNKKLNTGYRDFNEIKQPDGNFNRKLGAFYFEWTEFYREYYASYYKKLYDILKSHKIELPVIANIPQIYDYDVKGRGNMGIMTTSMFKNFGKYVKDVIFGGAYQYRRLDYENFTDITAMSEVVRMITPEGNPVICAEMQTGIMFDRPVLYPSDVELNIKASVGSGLNGINCYMFAGGVNFDDFGGFGNYHNWQSPVSDSGKLAPHYESVSKLGKFLKKFGQIISESNNVYEINIGLYLPYYQTEYLKGDFVDDLQARRDTMFFDGLLRLIRLAGFNYRFVDVLSEDLSKLDNLFLFSLEFMDRKTQEKIIKFIGSNKKMLIYPVVPEYDLGFRKCTLLKDYLGIRNIKDKFGANKIMKKNSDFKYYGGDHIYTFDINKKNSSPLFFDTDKHITSFVVNNNKSKVIIAGFDFTHKFDYQIEFIEEFISLLNIKKEIKSNNKRIDVVLKKGKSTDILFITNYTELVEKDNINLRSGKFPVDMHIKVPGRTGMILFVNYKLNDEILFYFITSEIKDIKYSKNKIIIDFINVTGDTLFCYNSKFSLEYSGIKKYVKKGAGYNLVKLTADTEISKIILKF